MLRRYFIFLCLAIGIAQALEFGEFEKKECSRLDYGHRVRRAMVFGDDISEAECFSTIATIDGFKKSPHRCWTVAGTMFAEFHVPDEQCKPYWSSFTDAGCSSQNDGVRVYRAKLKNLAHGYSAYDACMKTMGSLSGVFDLMRASRCNYGDVVTGEFHIDDDSCLSESDTDELDGDDSEEESDDSSTSTIICIERNGKFLSMQANGAIRSSTSCDEQELFELEMVDEDVFILRHLATGVLLSVSSNGQLCSSTETGEREQFLIEFNDQDKFTIQSYLGTYLGMRNGRWTTTGAQWLTPYVLEESDSDE